MNANSTTWRADDRHYNTQPSIKRRSEKSKRICYPVTNPMGNNAMSTPPKRSPTSANAGHTGTLSSSSPSRTVRYPVSPAKYSFLCVWRSSTTHAAQSACHLSNAVRPETCCEGVQDNRTSEFTAGPPELEGRETRKRRSSHQSSSWNRERGVFSVLDR